LRVFGPGAAGSKEIGKRWMGNWERVICFFGCFPSCYCLVFSPLFLLLPLSLLSLIVVSLDLAVSARGAHWVFRFGTAAAVLFGFCLYWVWDGQAAL